MCRMGVKAVRDGIRMSLGVSRLVPSCHLKYVTSPLPCHKLIMAASLPESGEVVGGAPSHYVPISDAHLMSTCHVRSLQCIVMDQ
jgi:hypothetical protein